MQSVSIVGRQRVLVHGAGKIRLFSSTPIVSVPRYPTRGDPAKSNAGYERPAFRTRQDEGREDKRPAQGGWNESRSRDVSEGLSDNHRNNHRNASRRNEHIGRHWAPRDGSSERTKSTSRFSREGSQRDGFSRDDRKAREMGDRRESVSEWRSGGDRFQSRGRDSRGSPGAYNERERHYQQRSGDRGSSSERMEFRPRRDDNRDRSVQSKPRFGLRRPGAEDTVPETTPSETRRQAQESASNPSWTPRSDAKDRSSQYERPQAPSRTPRSDINDQPLQARPQTASTDPLSDVQTPNSSQMPWRPAKKLTYQAMAGLRVLHANDPKTFDKDALSERFGISYEAVSRILKSNYQDRKAGDVGAKIQGTKWDLDARSSATSPVPAVNRAFGVGRAARSGEGGGNGGTDTSGSGAARSG